MKRLLRRGLKNQDFKRRRRRSQRREKIGEEMKWVECFK